MKITPEKIKEDFKRDTYWLRVYFISDDESRKSTLLVCSSREYLWDLFGARKPEEVKMNQWLAEVIKKWESLGDTIFNSPVQYDVYANTLEGKKNGLKFLKEEIVP
jgi:hypothetical protein